jgi:hypothetical protein
VTGTPKETVMRDEASEVRRRGFTMIELPVVVSIIRSTDRFAHAGRSMRAKRGAARSVRITSNRKGSPAELRSGPGCLSDRLQPEESRGGAWSAAVLPQLE